MVEHPHREWKVSRSMGASPMGSPSRAPTRTSGSCSWSRVTSLAPSRSRAARLEQMGGHAVWTYSSRFCSILLHHLDRVRRQGLLPAHRQFADRQRQFGFDTGAMETQLNRRTGHGMAPRRERLAARNTRIAGRSRRIDASEGEFCARSRSASPRQIVWTWSLPCVANSIQNAWAIETHIVAPDRSGPSSRSRTPDLIEFGLHRACGILRFTGLSPVRPQSLF